VIHLLQTLQECVVKFENFFILRTHKYTITNIFTVIYCINTQTHNKTHTYTHTIKTQFENNNNNNNTILSSSTQIAQVYLM